MYHCTACERLDAGIILELVFIVIIVISGSIKQVLCLFACMHLASKHRDRVTSERLYLLSKS